MKANNIEEQLRRGLPVMKIKKWLAALAFCQTVTFGASVGAVTYLDSDVQAEVNNTYSFQRVNESEVQFRRSPMVDEVGQQAERSIETFHQRLYEGNRPSLPAEDVTDWIPISSGVMFFIPKERIEYPLAKRVGDEFVQERLVRSQVYYQTGRHLLTQSFSSEAQQINTLYDNAFALSQKAGFNKKFGEPLSEADVDAHGLDVIWPELRTVNGEQVLVPIVHLANDHAVVGHEVSFSGEQALFRNVNIHSGSITTRKNALLAAAANINVGEGARIVGDGNLNMNVGGTLINTGSISASDAIDITAGNYYQKTLVHRFQTTYGLNDRLGIVSTIDAGSSIRIQSMSDITFLGAEAQAGSDIIFDAAGNIKIGTVTLSREASYATRNTSYQMSAIEHAQSSISAGDNIKLMAGGLIEINAANLHAERGHIELLAGLGVSIIDELNQEQMVAHREFGKMTEDESAYVTVAMRSVLDAGKGIRIHTAKGDITLKATDISSVDGTSVSASAGAINMLMAIENDHYSYSSVKEKLFTVTNVSRGHNYETAVPNTIVGGFETEALYGVNVEFEGDADNCLELQAGDPNSNCLQSQVMAMAEMPGMEWMQQVWDASDPSDFQAMELAYKEWNDKNTSLTPAAIAVISMVAAMAVGPAALEIGKAAAAATVGAGSSAAGVVSASVAAGVTSFTSQAAVAAGNGAVNGDIGDAMEEFITSDETWTSVATSMVTAAAISYVDTEFFTNEVSDADIQNYAQENGLGGVSPGSQEYFEIQDRLSQLTLGQQAAQAVTHASVSAGVDAIVYGDGIEEFTDSFLTNLGQNTIDLIGEKMANKIGDAAKNPDPELRINEATKYIAHAALGCVLGGAQSLNNGGNESEFGCISGAGGGVIGEFVATQIRNDFFDEAGQLIEDKELSVSELQDMYNAYQARGVNMARLTAGLTAFALQGDVNIAAGTAGNAAENNAFWFLVIPAFIALEKAYTVYEWVTWTTELGEALQAGDDDRAQELLEEKAADLGMDAAASLIPGGKTLKKVAEILKKKLPGNPEIGDDLAIFAQKVEDGSQSDIIPNANTSSIKEPKLEHHIGPRTPIKSSAHTLQEQRDAIDKVKSGEVDLGGNGNTVRKGNFGEMVTDDTLVNKGFTPLHSRITDIDQQITQGIDGVFEKDGKYFIVESKFGSSSLSKDLADGTNQMDDAWITKRIKEMGLPPSVEYDIVTNRNYTPVVAQVSKTGAVKFKQLKPDGSIYRGNKAKVPEIGQ